MFENDFRETICFLMFGCVFESALKTFFGVWYV